MGTSLDGKVLALIPTLGSLRVAMPFSRRRRAPKTLDGSSTVSHNLRRAVADIPACHRCFGT
jgi:hypothetical protein